MSFFPKCRYGQRSGNALEINTNALDGGAEVLVAIGFDIARTMPRDLRLRALA